MQKMRCIARVELSSIMLTLQLLASLHTSEGEIAKVGNRNGYI
jgi:hypothetical protein